MQEKKKKSTKKFRERVREGERRDLFFLCGKTMRRIEEIVTNL